MKLEIGKWYKNPDWRSDKDFLKCYNKNLDKEGYIIGREIINKGNYEVYDTEWFNGNKCIEATLEEIQPYLPEGHPDKINKSKDITKLENRIIGEYYYTKFEYDGNIGEIIVKWSKDGYKNQFINLHNKEYKVGSCCTSERYNSNEVIRLATQREREWLDYCIKIKKFVPLSEVPIPKEELKYSVTKKEAFKPFPRDFYVKVNSQEEVDKFFKYLKSKEESVNYNHNRNSSFKDVNIIRWLSIGWARAATQLNHLIERPLSDFIDIKSNIEFNCATTWGITAPSSITSRYFIDCNSIETLNPIKEPIPKLKVKDKTKLRIKNKVVEISNNKLNLKIKKHE